MRILVDGKPLGVEPGESLLVALLRAGLHPTGGGCLCAGGDCPHCLVAVDGVSYVRACQTVVRDQMEVERQHLDGAHPPLFAEDDVAVEPAEPVASRHLHCDVVVIGQGESGSREAAAARMAGKEVITLEGSEGEEAVGIYIGPLVVARTAEGTVQVHAREEVIVATGAAEIQPIAPGNELQGILTPRAAEAFVAAGIDLGKTVVLGTPPEGVEADVVVGALLRFEGEEQVEAIVIADESGSEHRHPCDTAIVDLGLQPRDTLYRMGRDLPQVRVVGDAARESDLPPCPKAGTLCPCGGVEVADLETVWEHGFHELELVKRATLAGTGTCQGSVCVPHIRSFLLDRGKELQPPFTARPVTRQLTIGEIAAGAHHHPTARTPLHDEHLALGARMERAGGWWRPWTYGDPREEYRAVRDQVSICDVSTLGKFVVSGPDAEAFLDFVYPTRVATIRPGRARYVLLLDERGYVLDDGMVCRDSENRFSLTLTSAGSTFGELWLRDWAESGGYDVRILNQTMSLGAINVTGPEAPELLARAGLHVPPGFLRHGWGKVAGLDCHVFRLSFTGELSWELHHAAADSLTIWRTLLDLGRDLGVRPHGLGTLLDLRLEKGHIVVGQDTDYDSTPRRLHHQWAARLDKSDFIGLGALRRTNRIALDKQLVGLEMEPPAPIEGEVIWNGGRHTGFVTSSFASPVLGKAVMLGWLDLEDGSLPDEVVIDGRTARRVATPFYDPAGDRARAEVEAGVPRETGVDTGAFVRPRFDDDDEAPAEPVSRFVTMEITRIVASADALDDLGDRLDESALRVADDELLCLAPLDAAEVTDEHALVEAETGFSVGTFTHEEVARMLEQGCAWEPPVERPAFAQGALAEIPIKLRFGKKDVLLLVPTPYLAELEERLP